MSIARAAEAADRQAVEMETQKRDLRAAHDRVQS